METSASTSRVAWASAVVLILLSGSLATHSVFAQADASSGGPTSAQLQSEIAIAASASAYSSGLLAIASAHHLNVGSEETLISSGNYSLAAAQGELSSGGNLTAGLQDALTSIKDFGSASVSLGAALQGSGLTISVDIAGAADAITSANATTAVIASIVTNACATISVNSTEASSFAEECSAGKADISASVMALNKASVTLGEVESGQPGATLSASAELVAEARGNLSQAAAIVSDLSAYTYTARGEAFVGGPIASEMSSANASVAAQASLSADFSSLVSSVQSSSAGIDNGVGNITSSASAAASAASSVGSSAVSSEASAQEATLTMIQSNLTLLSEQIPPALPSSITAILQGDITAAQTSLTVYDSAVVNSGTQASSYSQVSISGFAGYSTDFQSGASATQSDGQAFLSSYAALQVELSSVANQFPLLTILAQWSATLNSLGGRATSGSASLNSSLQTMVTALSQAGARVSAMVTTVQSSSAGIRVSSTLVQNATSVSSLEAHWLNSSGASTVSGAAAALQSSAKAAANFTASTQALLQLQVGQLGPAALELSSQGASLRSSASTALKAMASADGVVSADLQARVQAVASAKLLISQSLSNFEERQVSLGASALAEASADLRVAFSRAA
jgi:hypothetical protein